MTSTLGDRNSEARPAIGFIGWGRESEALLSLLERRFPGIGESTPLLPARGEPSPLRHTLPSAEGLFRTAEVIFAEGGRAALEAHLPMIRLAISDNHILVLLGGGWSLPELLEHLKERKLIRATVLPASMDSPGGLAFHPAPYFSPEEMQVFLALFAHLELCIELREEAHLEVLRSLAEFAPAAFYTVLESLADGVVMMGMPRQAALQYLASLLHGAAGRLLEGETTVARLREEALETDVAAAGLVELESAGVRGAMMRAIRAAVQYSRDRNVPPKTKEAAKDE